MTRNTAKHDWTVPTAGDDHYEITFDELFTDFDTDIEVRDEEQFLNSYDPDLNAKFVATDTGNIYLGDGNSWNQYPVQPEAEAVEDVVGGLLNGGTNVSLNYDDASNVLTVNTSALNQEEVEDAVASLVTAGNAITVNYDDNADALSIDVNESALSFYDGTNLTADIDATNGTFNSVNADQLLGIADHIVTTKAQLQSLFDPDNPDLSNGETVYISRENAPYRTDQVLYIDAAENNHNVTVYGDYAGFDKPLLKPEDGANVGGFEVSAQNVRIEGISYHGNGQNMTDDSVKMPFIFLTGEGPFYFGYNSVQYTAPYHVHNAGGDGLHLKPFGNTPEGVYGYHNEYDNMGDRAHTIQGGQTIRLFNESASNGYDRMTSLGGVKDVTLCGLSSKGNSDGSAFGLEDNRGEIRGITLVDCWAIGEFASYLTIESSANTQPIDDVTVLGGGGIYENNDKFTQANSNERPAINAEGQAARGRNHRIIGATFDGFEGGGVEYNHTDVVVDFCHFENISQPVHKVFAGVDPNIGARNSYENVGSLVNGVGGTRPRWDGVIAGGPFGGIDLSTVSGQFEGDRAVASGATAAAAGALARWDSTNSQWQYIDPSDTV